MDDSFKESHMVILDRFYLLFENIFKYVQDFLKFIKELDSGIVFIQQTFQSVLVNQEGKQLLAEGLYLYGVMLLLVDLKIPGDIRERMLMSYYRYKGSGEIPNIDKICKLFKNTGFAKDKIPPNYPLDYFNRIPLPSDAISMIIGRLRSDDIYLQTSFYPLPSHRSTALFTQAAMLYIILYFQPDILNKEKSIMREIVDKHFPDMFVITWFLGFTVDISVVWQPFKAASLAIQNTISSESVKYECQKHLINLKSCLQDLQGYLTEGVLQEDYVLDNISKLMDCLRACNVTLRWLLLHRASTNKKLRDIVISMTDPEQILLLLLNIAQFEYVLKKMFSTMLEKKKEKWDICKTQGNERILALAEYYSGEKVLAKNQKDEQLEKWFKDMGAKILELAYEDATLAGRKIQQIITALEEVEEFHQVNSSLHVKQYLMDTRDLLKKMIRYVNIKEDVMATISTISDISYAWEIINDYISSMQSRIKKDPLLIIKIRSTFLKLASILELPCVRIQQAKSDDIISVSKFYSGELVQFVRKVLEIIPVNMFGILSQIIDIQTNKLNQVPTRVPRDKLKDYAQLEIRYSLSKATYEVSKFTEGILAMEKTLIGIIEVDPKGLLEDGIRKELVKQIVGHMDEMLIFRTGKMQDFENRLITLTDKLQGMFRSFEYLQDYVNVYGLKILQEEFSRIINFNVEQECNRFLKKKIYEWQSQYQSEIIPIPKSKKLDEHSDTFMGRVVRELLSQTDPKKCTYIDQLTGWYDQNGVEVIGNRFFSILHQSIGLYGLCGIDTLNSYMIVRLLQKFVQVYTTMITNNPNIKKSVLEPLEKRINPPSTLPSNITKYYSVALSKLYKLWDFFIDIVIKVGRTQLLRKHTASELNFSCKVEANSLSSCLEELNDGLVNDLKQHFVQQDKPYLNEENPLLFETEKYLATTGMTSPFDKIYISSEYLEHLSLILFLFVIAHKDRFVYDSQIDSLVKKKKDDIIDGTPFIVGINTILQQFHSSEKLKFLAYCGQYIRAQLDLLPDKNPEIPLDVKTLLFLLENFCRLANIPRKVVESYVPSYLFARFAYKN